MSPAKTIYKLLPRSDDPRFEGFAFKREKSLRRKSRLAYDFMPDDISTRGRSWTVTRLQPFWPAQKVEGRVRSFNDFPCINLLIPAFSKRAAEVLKDLLLPNGELLPLESRVGQYYAYNVTTVADVLNHARSEIDWLDEDHVIADSINRFEIYPATTNGLSIFRIVEDPASTYVTDTFVDRVQVAHLNGFYFVKVWPFPKGVSWEREERKRQKASFHDQKPNSARGARANSLVVRLFLNRSTPTKSEKSRIKDIEDYLDAVLVDQLPDSVYYGSLEGDEYVPGECRLFLSCPDADALAEKLIPWLATVQWEGKMSLLKRYGKFTDPDAPEELVDR